MTATEDNNWSVPHTEVMRAARRFIEEDRRGVLATIVGVEGSAYRRPGAKMIIPEDGEGIGHITAGCLEDEVQRIAAEVIEAGQPRLETYDLMDGDDDVWGLGVGCNGVIDILLEPLDESYRPAVEAFDAGGRIGVLTVLPGGSAPEGARAYYDPETAELTADDAFPEDAAVALEDAAASLADQGRAETVTVETDAGDVRVFVDGIAAPPELVVFGTGHDVGPIAELGARNDFRVTVVGFRGAVDIEQRFPDAAETHTATAARLREDLPVEFDDRTYAVLATHNFVDDRLALAELLETDAPYVGLMGPHDRFEEMLAEFREEDVEFSADQLDRVYTPIGLNLGGGEPYQIATSIIAEVLAVHNGREPIHLREREGHIHDRVEAEVPSQ
jgi:xanthine dehydrogenase accessory factor